jgi:hypothetical protein
VTDRPNNYSSGYKYLGKPIQLKDHQVNFFLARLMKQKMAEESSEAQSTHCTWRSFNSATLAAEMFFLLFNATDVLLLLPSIRLLIQSTTYQEVSDTHGVTCNSTNTTSKQAVQLASTYLIANSVLRNVPSVLLPSAVVRGVIVWEGHCRLSLALQVLY